MLNTRSEKLLLFTLAFLQFTNIMDFMIMMPLGPQLMQIFEITPSQFSVVVSSYSIASGIAGFTSAFIIDSFDRKRALIFLYTGFLIGTASCALAPTYLLLVAARFLTGLFGGVLGAVVFAIIGDVIASERQGYAMGTVSMAFAMASVFGVPFGLFLANTLSWHAPFLFLVGIGLAVKVFIFHYIPSLPPRASMKFIQESMQMLKEIFTSRNQVLALTLIPLLVLAHFTLIPFLSAYMVSNVGFTNQTLTFIYLFGGLASMVSAPFLGRLSDRVGHFRVLMAVSILCIGPIVWITHMGPTPLPIALIATTVFFIVAGGRFVPSMALVQNAVPPHRRGGFMSFNTAFQSLFTGLASFIAGFLVTRNGDGKLEHYEWVGYLAITATLATLFIARLVKPYKQEH